LLRDLTIGRPNQVWAADITYIPMARGFLYLVVVIDWHSRYVLAWRLSNTMDSSFCLDALEDALRKGRPEIFNTDQGAQFTSAAFTDKLEAAGVRISMDGRGRWLDNVFVERLLRSLKHEEVRNERRLHQAWATKPRRRRGRPRSALWICRCAWTTLAHRPQLHRANNRKTWYSAD
jgi:transposase InsO family protein